MFFRSARMNLATIITLSVVVTTHAREHKLVEVTWHHFNLKNLLQLAV